MIKILIVEDEREKLRLIMQAVLKVPGMSHEDVAIVSDSRSAKKLIAIQRFDLLLLDINVPFSSDKDVSTGGGLDVLRFIKVNAKAKQPGFIVGLTAYDDGAAAAADEFASPLWKLVRFSYTDLEWMGLLEEAIQYLVSNNRPPYKNDGHTYHYDLGIVVALNDGELSSILGLDANWKLVEVAHDPSDYYGGTFSQDNRSLSVVAVAAPIMGMPAAAVTATKLIHTFRPRYLAITGICAGVRGKTELGDVLIADPCFDWGSGKWKSDPDTQKLEFLQAPYQWRLDPTIQASAKALASDKTLLTKIRAAFDGNKPSSPPHVLIDAMASGASVLQASTLMKEVKAQHKNLIGIEMESYAVFTAASYSADPRPTCVSIKSVCDFGDETKSDEAHSYAAHTSANFLYYLALKQFATETGDRAKDAD